MNLTALRLAGFLAGAVLAALPVSAQQFTYNFDNFAAGTIITDDLAGVTISVVPQSCGGTRTLYMRVGTPSGGTSSGTKALGIDTGCPDFSPDYLRMVFDNLQSSVSFTVGDYACTYVVRAYSDAGLIQTQNIIVEGTGTVGVHRIVRVNIPAGILRRVEVEATPSGLFEWIDDLTFDLDTTPPIANISFPTDVASVCGVVQIRGSAYDPDGTYDHDTLEYKAANSDEWVTVGSASTPVEDGLLYNWNTTSLAEGFYMLRLTVENDTNLVATDTAFAWVSQDFDTVSFVTGSIVGGAVCPDGTAFDNYTTGDYTVEYSRSSPISYQPVDPAHPTYSGYKVNEQLATWDTGALTDGNYLLRVTGTNTCGDTRAVTHTVVVDNTAPSAVITSPSSCGAVEGIVSVQGAVSDAHLAGWSLYYTGGDVHGWALISSGVGPVSNGSLGNWDTRSLRHCQYTLRLVATDRANVNCGSTNNQTDYTVSVTVGCEADFNSDGVVNSQDFFDFLNVFFTGC
jgi:hypothetical protein